jgi:hypothetical protein
LMLEARAAGRSCARTRSGRPGPTTESPGRIPDRNSLGPGPAPGGASLPLWEPGLPEPHGRVPSGCWRRDLRGARRALLGAMSLVREPVSKKEHCRVTWDVTIWHAVGSQNGSIRIYGLICQ